MKTKNIIHRAAAVLAVLLAAHNASAQTAPACGDGETQYSALSGNMTVDICADTLAFTVGFAPHDCEGAGWGHAYHTASGATAGATLMVRSVCGIPHVTSDDMPPEPPAAAGLRALSADPTAGTNRDGCILAETNDSFSSGDSTMYPLCRNMAVFLTLGGLPRMPAGFDATSDRITIFANGVAQFDGMQIARFVRPSGDSNLKRNAAIGLGAIGIIGVAALFMSGGDVNAFNFTPNYQFSHGNGAPSYSYGSRVDFQKDNISAFWGAGRAVSGGATGAWIYSGGMEYAEEFWHAKYTSEVWGKNANMAFAGNVRHASGIYRWQSGINADWDAADSLSASWKNSMTADYHGWKIAPSASMQWRQGEDFGGMDFRLDLRREF